MGLHSPLLVPWLFGVPTHTPLKNRVMGVTLPLGGGRSIKIPNNQLIVGGSVRI